jgi:hypothetical protein
MLTILSAAALVVTPLDAISNDICNSGETLGIPALIDVWRKDAEINLSDEVYALIGGRPQDLHSIYEECTVSPGGRLCRAVSFEVSIIVEWMDALTDMPVQGPRRLVALGSAPIEGIVPLQRPDEFQIECGLPPGRAASTSSSSTRGNWRLAQDLSNLRKPSLDGVEFASIAFTDDVKNDTQTQRFQFAIGRRFEQDALNATLMPFVAVNRQSQIAASPKEENVFQVGLNAQFRSLNEYGFWNTEIAYLTDDSLEASAWRFGASFSPNLDVPGYEAFHAIWNDGPLDFVWTMEFAVDHLTIDETGDAFENEDSEATRIGGNLYAAVRTFDPIAGITPQLSVSYSVREPFLENGDSFSNIRAAFDFLPEKDGNLRFGISYQSGEDLDSGKFAQQWLAGIGVRY